MTTPAANPNTSEATCSALCRHCGGEISIRNPTGTCDHLYWPDMLTDEAKRANGFVQVMRPTWEKQNAPAEARASASPLVAGSAIPDWKRRLPVNNNGNPPLTWEGPNGPCEEKHGTQCQCEKCVGPNAQHHAEAGRPIA